MLSEKPQFETIGHALLVRAPAKINLSLLIAGKRPDGFHEIETVMAKVNWYDEILIEAGPQGGIELICKGPYWAPEGKENLVYRAAESLMNACSEWADIRITLTKNIPAGSGLGSASSDAAATLLALNRYLDIGLPNTQLAKLAPRLGSDVAFFLNGPLALCKGKGEKITKLKQKFDFLAVLILPDINISTKKVYVNYTHDQSRYENLHAAITDHIQKNRIDSVVGMCANMLEQSCFSLVEDLAEMKAEVESSGTGPVCLSGSGSAMFCVIDSMDAKKAGALRDRLTENVGCKSLVVRNNRW